MPGEQDLSLPCSASQPLHSTGSGWAPSRRSGNIGQVNECAWVWFVGSAGTSSRPTIRIQITSSWPSSWELGLGKVRWGGRGLAWYSLSGKHLPPPHANTLHRVPDSRRSSQALGATGCLAGSVGSTAQAANFPHHHPAGVKQTMLLCATLVGGGEGSILSLRSPSSPTPGVPGCGSGPTWEREKDC